MSSVPHSRMSRSLHNQQYALFLQELRALRERTGVSQDELARRMGEQQSFISKCEAGHRRLDLVETCRWADALDVSFARFAKDVYALLGRNASLGAARVPVKSKGMRQK